MWYARYTTEIKEGNDNDNTCTVHSSAWSSFFSTHRVSVANDRSSELHSKSLNQCNAALSLLLAKIKCLRQRYRTLRVKRKRIEY